MPDTPLELLLQDLGSENPEKSWNQFLNEHANSIYQVITHYESDIDKAADCFQFVCEQLIRDRAKRLRKFKLNGSATFATWLRAVVRNLCIDWHRSEFGRHRIFRSISRQSTFDQEVFQLIYERGLSADDSILVLTGKHQNVTLERIAQSQERIEKELTTRQRWLLVTRLPVHEAELSLDQTDSQLENVVDQRPDPETQAAQNERLLKLQRALNSLDKQDRLLIRMRYQQDLTLQQVANLVGAENPQRVDRMIKNALTKLRKEMD